VTAVLGGLVSSILLERMSLRVMAELRLYISERILKADFRKLESLGSARVQAALSEHCSDVAGFFTTFPSVLTNVGIVAACMVYMFMLSGLVFVVALAVVGLGAAGYHFAHVRAIAHIRKSSEEHDAMFSHFRSLTDGAKELRLHGGKRAVFLNDVLARSIEEVRRTRTTGMSIFLTAGALNSLLMYGFFGLILFALVGDVPDRSKVVTGYALVVLYMASPLQQLLSFLPRTNVSKVAADRINEIIHDLPITDADETGMRSPVFESLQLCGVRHRYYHEQSDGFFELGPIDLEFHPGTITFLVGGNGSGKTTLAKLLVGLYAPEEGEVWLNGEHIDESSRDRYRQNFSAVFSDYYLFERLLQIDRADLDVEGNRLLARLHLQHKVEVRDGAFTTQSLSQGQRKRLALVVACLEERPFLVFDEWAADQDPTFKDVFYHEILQELKAQGKTILVISHDDRYFHLGDHLLRLENGCLATGDEISRRVPETRLAQQGPAIPPQAMYQPPNTTHSDCKP
jgi:putative ATP-binding cassette transporter